MQAAAPLIGKARKSRIALIVALWFAAFSHAALVQARAQTLGPTIRDYARAHDFNGTILVQHKAKTVYQQSFGTADRAFDIPVKNDTEFRIASITKAFTAVLILQLYEQGRLDLRATI